METALLPEDEVRQVCLIALRRAGVPESYATAQVDLLLDAELRGVYSHGLLRLPRIVERIRSGACDPSTAGQGQWIRTAFYEVDGRSGLGPVVALEALHQLGERVARTGMAIAAVHNCEHLGMLNWYAERMARHGFVLIALTISEALVHPWGGTRALLGTNPIAIGIPSLPEPFTVDMC